MSWSTFVPMCTVTSPDSWTSQWHRRAWCPTPSWLSLQTFSPQVGQNLENQAMQICITGTNVGAFLTGLTCTNLDFKMKKGNVFWLSLGRRKPETDKIKMYWKFGELSYFTYFYKLQMTKTFCISDNAARCRVNTSYLGSPQDSPLVRDIFRAAIIPLKWKELEGKHSVHIRLTRWWSEWLLQTVWTPPKEFRHESQLGYSSGNFNKAVWWKGNEQLAGDERKSSQSGPQ